jgi:hypothetical protein
MKSFITLLRRGYRVALHWLVGPDSVAPGYAIETNGRKFRLVHLETRCWAFADSIRDARRASWHWHRCEATWRPIERANARNQGIAPKGDKA